MPVVRNIVVFTPHHAFDVPATVTTWMRGRSAQVTTAGAGVVYSTSPTTPQGTTLGERWIEFDGNSADHDWYWTPTGVYADGEFAGDTTRRWGYMVQHLFRHGEAAGDGDSNPATDALIWQSPALGGTLALWYTTGRKLRLVEGGVDVGTGTTVHSVNTNYVFEVIEVRYDSTGAALATKHVVVRSISGFGGALTTTVEIDALYDDATVHSTPAVELQFGENTARGAGFKFFVSQLARGWVDCNDMPGVIRNDRLDIDGIGRLDQGPGTVADVNDDADAASKTTAIAPDDGTTEDSITVVNTDGVKTQLYTGDGPTYAVSADAVLALNIGYRVIYPITGKDTLDFYVGLGDGTVERWSLGVNQATAYQSEYRVWDLDAGSGAWAHGDLAGVQAGIKVSTSGATSRVCRISAITTFVAYRKSGETTAALPTTGEPLPKSLVFRRSSMRAQLVR